MAGGVPVVTPSGDLDPNTVGQLRAVLLEWHSRGYTRVVVDMTSTQFCDSSGLRELVLAHKRSVADGGGLRLVIPEGGAVLRVFNICGLDQVIPRFTSLGQALAAGQLGPPAAARAATVRSGAPA
jgi:anti-sigma B factor antagonist